MDQLINLSNSISSCGNCNLALSCRQPVPGEGTFPANIMMIGEAPGEIEDLVGRPFVGPAGKLLDSIIKAIGWERSDIYITNVVKCRPPGNRNPSPDEIVECRPFLNQEIKVVNPKVIICWGSISAKELIHPSFQITKEHGTWFNYEGREVIALFHPAYLLRLSSQDALECKRKIWKAIQEVNNYLKEEQE